MADSPLTGKQQLIWQNMCSELVQARMQVKELETRLKTLERQNADENPSVLTRPEFNREVARMLAFDERYGGISSVLYFDIENLDTLATQHGHQAAEYAVRCVSDALAHNIRRSDILGRLATDEFGVLLPRCDNANAWKKGEQLAGAVFESLAAKEGLTLRPTVTYGAYTFQDKEDLATGLKRAASNVTRLATPSAVKGV